MSGLIVFDSVSIIDIVNNTCDMDKVTGATLVTRDNDLLNLVWPGYTVQAI